MFAAFASDWSSCRRLISSWCAVVHRQKKPSSSKLGSNTAQCLLSSEYDASLQFGLVPQGVTAIVVTALKLTFLAPFPIFFITFRYSCIYFLRHLANFCTFKERKQVGRNFMSVGTPGLKWNTKIYSVPFVEIADCAGSQSDSNAALFANIVNFFASAATGNLRLNGFLNYMLIKWLKWKLKNTKRNSRSRS